jgi:hypothetical protein
MERKIDKRIGDGERVEERPVEGVVKRDQRREQLKESYGRREAGRPEEGREPGSKAMTSDGKESERQRRERR